MDVIVVGAGVVGLAAGFELSRAGHRVTIISADVPGSRQSAGLSRIFRLAHADRELTDAAARSLGLWQRWESLGAAPLLDRVGLLLTGDMSDRAPHLRQHSRLEARTGAAHPLALEHDRWLLEPTGAAIRAEATIRFLRGGLDIVLADVTAVDRAGVTLADEGRREADRVLVCAGADTNALIGLPAPERRRSVRFSFPLREPLEHPAPCWIQRDDRLSEPFYAVMDGLEHYSVGLSEAAPAAIPEAVHIRDAHRRTVELVGRLIPGVIPVAERVIACEYAINSSSVHEHDGVVGISGPSLFKFAPLLGAIAAGRLSALSRTSG